MQLVEETVKPQQIERANAFTLDTFKLAHLIISDLHKEKSYILRKYSAKDIHKMMEGIHKRTNQQKLRELSRMLYMVSPHYKKIIDYEAGLYNFAWYLLPKENVDVTRADFYKKKFMETATFVDNMNLPHEFLKVLKIALREDVFYGYVFRTKDEFFIKQISADICRIVCIENGVYNFEIDMSYFDNNPTEVSSFGREIEGKYEEYKAMKRSKKAKPKDYQWVELDGRNTICIKVTEDILHPCPPYAGVFESIFDLDSYKMLRRDKSELENYSMLIQKLPTRDSDNNNDFRIDNSFMEYFHNMIAEGLPEGVGLATTPMDVDVVQFKESRFQSDNVSKAEAELFNNFGISPLLFGASNTTVGVTNSIHTDEMLIFNIARQIERWINRYLGYHIPNNIFRLRFVDVTVYNQADVIKQLLSVGQYGLPIKSMLCSAVGISPSATMNMAILENQILELQSLFVPLLSSFTMDSTVLLEGQETTNKQSGSSNTKQTDSSNANNGEQNEIGDENLSPEGEKSQEKRARQ